MPNLKPIHVRALSPGQVLFEGEALAVSSRNSEGNFDILAGHANFITIIENYPIVILQTDNQKFTLNPKQAIIYNYADKISIYTDPKIDRKNN